MKNYDNYYNFSAAHVWNKVCKPSQQKYLKSCFSKTEFASKILFLDILLRIIKHDFKLILLSNIILDPPTKNSNIPLVEQVQCRAGQEHTTKALSHQIIWIIRCFQSQLKTTFFKDIIDCEIFFNNNKMVRFYLSFHVEDKSCHNCKRNAQKIIRSQIKECAKFLPTTSSGNSCL